MTNILTITMNPALDVSTAVEDVHHTSKLRCEPMHRRAGGGGVNVARELHRLGADALAFYTAGHATGRMMFTLLQQEGVSCHPYAISGFRARASPCWSAAAGTSTALYCPAPRSPSRSGRARWQKSGSSVNPSRWSLPVAVCRRVCQPIFCPCRRGGAGAEGSLIVDTSGEPLRAALEHGLFMVKPSLHELRDLCGKPLTSLFEVREAARELVSAGSAKLVVVSMGEMGAMLVSRQGAWYAPPLHVVVHSAVGAGDSFVAGMVWALAQQENPVHSFAKGVACATATLLSTGSGLGDTAQVLELLKQVQCSPDFADLPLPV